MGIVWHENEAQKSAQSDYQPSGGFDDGTNFKFSECHYYKIVSFEKMT